MKKLFTLCLLLAPGFWLLAPAFAQSKSVPQHPTTKALQDDVIVPSGRALTSAAGSNVDFREGTVLLPASVTLLGQSIDLLSAEVVASGATASQIYRRNAAGTGFEFATISPVITLGGDLTGSVTLTNLGSGTLTATITPVVNPAWVTSLPWAKITATPTTAAGYGITGGAALDSWAAISRASGFDTFVATPSGANLASLLTSALPASKGGTGLTALGTGVATALGNTTNATGGLVTFSGNIGAATGTSLTLSSLTSGRVTYATTSGLLTDSAGMTYNGVQMTLGGARPGDGSGQLLVGAAATNSEGGINFNNGANAQLGFVGYTRGSLTDFRIVSAGGSGTLTLANGAGNALVIAATTMNVALGSTTASTSTTTGALTVSGGLGVGGRGYFGNMVRAERSGVPTQYLEMGGSGPSGQMDIWAVGADKSLGISNESGSTTTANHVAIGTGVTGAVSEIVRFQSTASKSAWGSTGIGMVVTGRTYTDTSTAVSGTAATAAFYAFARPTLAATNASVTTTAAATVYIANSPAAGANQTITNPWALWVDDGNVRVDSEIHAGSGAAATSVILNRSGGNWITMRESGVNTWDMYAPAAGVLAFYNAGDRVSINTTGLAIGVAASTSTRLNLAASTTGVSSLRIPHGSAPSSPVDGDVWTTTAGLYIRINGATVGPLN